MVLFKYEIEHTGQRFEFEGLLGSKFPPWVVEMTLGVVPVVLVEVVVPVAVVVVGVVVAVVVVVVVVGLTAVVYKFLMESEISLKTLWLPS